MVLLPYLISGLLYIPRPWESQATETEGVRVALAAHLSCARTLVGKPFGSWSSSCSFTSNKYCGPHGSCLFYFLSGQDSSKGEAMASWAHSEDSRKASGLFTRVSLGLLQTRWCRQKRGRLASFRGMEAGGGERHRWEQRLWWGGANKAPPACAV